MHWKSNYFPTVYDSLAELESQQNDDVRSDVMHHLQGLEVTVKDYFPPKVEDVQWLRYPFVLSAITRINNKTIQPTNQSTTQLTN
jgi:hypothetical protein